MYAWYTLQHVDCAINLHGTDVYALKVMCAVSVILWRERERERIENSKNKPERILRDRILW